MLKNRINKVLSANISVDNTLIIAGPCSAETEEQVMETILAIPEEKINVFRSGIWKPRTRPNSFEGVGSIGLSWVKKAGIVANKPVTVEVANSHHVEECLKAGIDILWIGARTTVNPFAVQDIADSLRGIDIPVMVKNPINPDLDLWIGAMERLSKAGITKLIAIHRGFSSDDKGIYRNKPIWRMPLELRRLFPELPIICDPSHICGNTKLLLDVCQQAMDLDFDGLMIETHINPSAALSDAQQQITPYELEELLNQIIYHREKSGVVGYDKFQLLQSDIDEIDKQLLTLLSSRIDISKKINNREDLDLPVQATDWKELIKSRIAIGRSNNLSEQFVADIFYTIYDELYSAQGGEYNVTKFEQEEHVIEVQAKPSQKNQRRGMFMLENFIERGLGYYSRKFGKRSATHYYNNNEVNEKIAMSGIKKLAVLIDGETTFNEFSALKANIIGFYSFSLDCIGTLREGKEIMPLLPGKPPSDIDGWLMSAGNVFANYSLNQYLLENNRENQIIVKHMDYIDGTKYYSYIDFFSNEQKTILQINNYFKRCYEIPFPLDLQLTLRNSEGKILETKQIIIPPNGTRVLTSDDFKSENFVGYLEVEFDVSSKVNKFLHYYATYISEDFISNNHQSGLGLHPAYSAFTRGFIPENPGETLVVCLFQKNYTKPVVAKAVLQYNDSTSIKTVEKQFPLVKKNEMLFLDIKKFFKEVDFSKTKSPIVTIIAEVPLHRPNFYYAMKGKKGYYDISHAGADPKTYVGAYGDIAFDTNEQGKMNGYDCNEMDLRQFIFPESTGIESLFGFAGDSTVPLKDLLLEFYNQNGELVSSFEYTFDYDRERFIDLGEFLRKNNMKDFSGSVSVRPSTKAEKIPTTYNGISAYRHKKRLYITSTAASGGSPDNIPFYFSAGPQNYLLGNCSTGVTEIYGPALCSDVFDTYFCIAYPSADKNLKKKIEYEIQVYNTEGKSRVFYRTINAHGTDFFKVSDLLSKEGFNSEKGSYTLWFFSVGAHLYGQRILLRKSDNAISVEHCYPGKYGI